ncbi:hypothetical protein [Demequina aurantiaca]|uniref:hypothetical protein n=1 Tax=Demequina aurantiaca TaxID=676200 RepID=UPI00128C572D|nr:hypothetical protein [Demequina aurantiaca]
MKEATPMGRPAEASEEKATVALLTPLPNGKVLAALCSLNSIDGKVIETGAGAFAVLDDTSEGAVDNAGKAISTFLKEQPMLAMERRGGHITIHRWSAGEKGESLSPGFALDQAPSAITNLMMGTENIEDFAVTHPDKVHDANMGRFKAFKELRKMAKEANRREGL